MNVVSGTLSQDFNLVIREIFANFAWQKGMRTLILDFDGTIADTREAIFACVSSTLTFLNLPIADEASVRQVIGLPLKDTFTKAGISDENLIQQCIKTYREKFAEICGKYICLYPGVKETLAILKENNINIAVASSRGKASLVDLLSCLGIAEYIDIAYGEQDVTHPKPAPDMVFALMDYFKATSGDALVVGDTTFDIEMGKNAGCATCGVTYGNHTLEQLLSRCPDFTTDSFSKIPKFMGL